MSKVIRYMIADYLNTGTETPVWSLMGTGFNTLDENPTATVESKAYISDPTASGAITGYTNSFAFDVDLNSEEAVVKALYEVGRNQKTGADAEFEYIRIEMYEDAEKPEFPARKFKVACEVASIAGVPGESIKVTGNLHQVGSMVEGTFNTSTKIFTVAE